MPGLLPAWVFPQRSFDPDQDHRHGLFQADVLAVAAALTYQNTSRRLRFSPMWTTRDCSFVGQLHIVDATTLTRCAASCRRTLGET